MKSLFSMDAGVPLARALREHRAWLVPLALVLIVNAALLLVVVMPLSRAAAGNEQRALAAQTAVTAGERDLENAEALRNGKVQATSDLDVFYRDVLPGDVSAARRLTHIKLAQMAAEHNVLYERGSTSHERLKDSTLGRLHVQLGLTGEYADIRSFLHGLETAADFVVIDNFLLAEGKSDARNDLSLTLDVSTYFPEPAGSNAR